jgi:hypothetical protein
MRMNRFFLGLGIGFFIFCIPLFWVVCEEKSENSTNRVAVIESRSLEENPPLFQKIINFDQSIWEIEGLQFQNEHLPFGFQWVSSLERSTVRSDHHLSFFGFTVLESIARFRESPDANKLKGISLLLYASSSGEENFSKEDFQKFREKIENSMNTWTGMKARDATVVTLDPDLKRKSWFKFPLRVNLDWSATEIPIEADNGDAPNRTEFQAQLLRITFSPYNGKDPLEDLARIDPNLSKTAIIKLKDLQERIQKETNGDVYLKGVPMVNQGSGEYCVVASMERLLRYYGFDIDQYEMTGFVHSRDYGTSSEDMFTALKKMGERFSLSVNDLQNFKLEDFLAEIKEYNSLAQQKKAKEIEIPKSGLIIPTEIYEEMDLNLLREVYRKRIPEKNKFGENIATTINRGAPVLWSVLLGFLENEDSRELQDKGGHLRLIIGYNFKDPKKPEIIYTDSWGAGHEHKRMSLDDAFFITRGVYTVVPDS